MKLQSSLFYWGALLLLTSTPRGPRTGLGETVIRTYCQDVGSNSHTNNIRSCDTPVPGAYCGIDKVTGAIQGCVPADQCPPVTEEKTVFCSATKPSCCCGRFFKDEVGGQVTFGSRCNHMLDPDDDTQWKQACSLPELKNSPACKVNPTSKVWCSREFVGTVIGDNNCGADQFCGIDKRTGELNICLEATYCPSSALGSREIVCEPGKPYCCCQSHAPKGIKPVGPDCNNFKEVYTIWKQACGLKELRDLDVCKGNPPTTTTTTSSTEEPTDTTGKTKGSTIVVPGVTKAEDFMSKDTSERNVVIAVIVILVIIVLLVIGGLVYYFLIKRRAAGVPYAYQQQQQVYQMTTVPATYYAHM